LETRIREATPDDAAAIALIYGPYVLNSPATFETVPPDAAEMRSRIESITKNFPWLVAEGPDGIEGYAYASLHRERPAYQWAADVSAYVVKPGSHRRGIGRRLYTDLFEIVGQQGYTNVFAGITLPNDASVGLHRAMGFELVGIYRQIGFKLGAWHDTSWWQLRLRDDAEPSPPVGWREV
jgi:phosphinothricin acetyltransferase